MEINVGREFNELDEQFTNRDEIKNLDLLPDCNVDLVDLDFRKPKFAELHRY